MSNRIVLPLCRVGWSSEAPLSDNGTGHLLACKNYVIKQNLLESRKGYFQVAAVSVPVQTLIPIEEYNILLACSGGNIYVYHKTAVGLSLIATKTGYSTDQWNWIYVNHQIIMVNGQDNAQQVVVSNIQNQTPTVTISDWGVSGAPSKYFAWVALLNAQVVAGFGNDLVAWYLEPGYVQGALSKFDIGASSGTPHKGGNIIGGFNINRDAGMSLNAYSGFITDQGEAIVYTGNDFGDAANIAFNGIYQTGYPLGKKPFINWSGDLIIMTNKGFISAHSIFANGEDQSAQFIFSQKINTWLLEQSAKFGAQYGFMGQVVPNEDIVLFNIPQGPGEFVQVCMNITSGKWSLWNSINAYTMCVFDGELLFGMAGGVYQYGNSALDNNFIPLEIWTAYTNCGADLLKRVNMLQLRHSASDDIQLTFDVYTDFSNQAINNWTDTSGVPESVGESGFIWSNYALPNDPTPGTAYWDTEYWAGGYGDMVAQQDTFSAPAMGHNISVKITARVNNIKHQVVDLMLLFSMSQTAI